MQNTLLTLKEEKHHMFCYQCEQTANGTGCTISGVCGKNPEVATLQDLLIYALKCLSATAIVARENKIDTKEIDFFIEEGLFATVTNVDFDPERIVELVNRAANYRDQLLAKLNATPAATNNLPAAATLHFAKTKAEMLQQGQAYNIIDKANNSVDIQSLKNTVLFGIKGIAAYADHAAILGQEDRMVYHFIQKALANMLRYDLTLEQWFDLAMECGKINLHTMELLDLANTNTYGHPTPTTVPLGARTGKAILVSGHDLRDLELLLKQTENTGIYIYTHGEMLPTHGYPLLKKYSHFYGHYGTAWQNQHQEFAAFPGAILMTTNCIQKPLPSYQDHIFTTGLVGWPQVAHLKNKDFTPVIEKALALPGFTENTDQGTVMVGFGHNTVMKIANKIVNLVKAGKIRHFFLVAGCDGAKPGRNYYTEFVEKLPKDCVVLTLACGKFRFFDQQLGSIDGIPRLLDMGQCNDAYSAIQIALALAKAFNVGVNELPLSLVLSWYEQKAVAILLTLLALGIKNIRLGPSLPAFISPNVLKVLVDKFAIKPITTVEKDIEGILHS